VTSFLIFGQKQLVKVAGFFLWEALGMFSFKTKKLRFKRNKYLTYIAMKIEFVETNNKKEPK